MSKGYQPHWNSRALVNLYFLMTRGRKNAPMYQTLCNTTFQIKEWNTLSVSWFQITSMKKVTKLIGILAPF